MRTEPQIYSFLNLSEGITTQLAGFERWAVRNNPAFEGPYADMLGLVPILIVSVLLYLIGRERFVRA